MHDDLSAIYEYNRWADARVIQAIRQLTPGQYTQEAMPGCPSVRAALVHMADASLIWTRRIRGEQVTSRITEADVPTLAEAEAFLTQTHEAYGRLIPTLSPEQLSASVPYHDLQGEPKSLPVWVILRHVVNHSSYHRGQISMNCIHFGVEPPMIDFVLWAFQNKNG